MRLHTARFGAAMLPLMLGGCVSANIDQASFFPQAAQAPVATLAAPAGYRVTDETIGLGDLGAMHVVRLDNPASDAAVIFSGGNGNFVSAATGADVILYDYPGRGGTTIPATIDASIATGPRMLDALRARGWIGNGPLFAYGLSFGGSQAAAMARGGGFDGLIVEGSAADIASVGRNFVPALARPFVKLRVDPELRRFDYLGYAVAARAPILLIASKDDTVVKERNMRDFEKQLRSRGAAVTFVAVPGSHGTALGEPTAKAAIGDFVRTHSRR